MLFSSLRIFKLLAMALIRLPVCAGWSEPLLVKHTTLLEISCCRSYIPLAFSRVIGGHNHQACKKLPLHDSCNISSKRGVDFKVNKAESVL